MECVSCGSNNTQELPDTVASTDGDGNPIQAPNTGRVRTEYHCQDCGACFVERPPDWEDRTTGWKNRLPDGVKPSDVVIR